MGDINAVLKSVKTRNTKLTSRSHLKALKKIRLILEDLTKALFKRVAIWSCKQLTQWKTCLNAPQNITEYLKSSGQNRGDWKISYFMVNVPLHAEIVQCINEGLLSDNDSDGELSNPDSKSMLHYSVAKRDIGHSSTVVSKTSKQIMNTRVIANVQSYGKNQHGAVDEVEINHSNSSRCGCNRSFTAVSHVQGPSSGRSDNCGTWGQMCSDPGRMANSGGGCSSGGQNATKCPSSCPIKSVNDISKETDINKIAASCIRRYTLEESKALATSSPMYRPNPCSPTQKSCDNMKPTASCPGEQMSTTPKMPGKKVEGQAELSLKPLSSPKCRQNYSRMRQNESVTADSSDGQCRRGLQSSSMCRPTKPQNDKCMRNSTESFDDFKSFCNPGYSQPSPPTNMQRNPANRKSGRHSPCRIAITGCERPVLPSYCPPRISNPEIDSRDRFSRRRTDYGVCGDMSKSTSRFLNTGEDGECGGSSQRLTGGEKMNRDCCQQSSRYPISPSPKWNNTTAKDVSCDCLKGNRPQDSRNEDQELRYGDDSCQKNPGGYSFKIKYTEVEEADSPSTPDASDDDCLGKPNQLQVRDRNRHSPNECSCKSPCKTPSNSQHASCKYSVEDYSRDDDEVGYQGCENFDGDTGACPDDYYGNDSSVPPFLQDESSCGRIRASKHTYEDPSAIMMQRYQQNYMSCSPDFAEFSRSPHQPQQRYMEENRGCMHQMWSDMERSPNWHGNTKNSERARCMSRAHSEECPSPYPVCKKSCGIRRKRSRKRCVSRRQPTQKCSGRPRKVVKLSRRASMELERRYAAQVPRSESSLACEAARNKRRYSPPDSCREDAIVSGENKKCLCRSSSRCVMVNPCYRNNRAALLRRKFNAAKIEEEGDPCCCVMLFRSTPVQGNDFSPGQFSESCEEREGGAFNCCMNGEQVERDPCRKPKSPCSRSPIPLNGCQPRERDTEAKKNSCRSNTPCLNIDLKGKKIMLRKFENTTNCASSELTLPENMCGKNSANNDISIALGDKTIIIKNPDSNDQTTKEEESKEGDKKEKCTQCAKKRSFFARMCDKFKKKCAKANAQNQTDEEVKDDDSDDTDTGDGSKCMPVNDTTSCSLRFNETRSYNCSACSTSRCVSNQSHSFMDFTDDPTTNLQLTMRSWNNTASEPHSGVPAFVQHPLINSRGWCKSERVYHKTGRRQCRADYRMRTCPTGMWQNNLCARSHSFAPDMSVKCCSVDSKALVTKCLCKEVNLGVPSCKKPTMRIRKERNFKLNGVCFCSKYGYPNKGYYFPLLAFGHSIEDNSDQVIGPKRLRNYHRFAQCPCYRSYIRQFPYHGGKVSPERGDRDYEKEDRMKAIEKSKNSNNFSSGMNEFDCCAKSMGNGGPTTEGGKTASSQCFTRNSSSHFLHEPTIKPPHQGSASTKNTCDDLKRLDRPLFQTINRPCYEVLALFKRPLAKNHKNELMIHEPQKSKYLDSHYQPALRKVRTDPSTVKSKNVNTSSRWPRISTPYKKGSHTLPNGRTIENLGEVDNRRFSATKSTDEFTCSRVESALLSPLNKTCGYVEVRPICKQPVVIKSSVKSKSGLDVPFYAKNWSQSMPKFQPSPVRSSSFMMPYGNTLSAKPAFLPRNSAPSLQTRRSYGQVPPSICSKASFNNMCPHHCRVSFDSKPVNPPYESMGCGNYPRGANYPTGFSKMSERIMPPVPCQRAYSLEIAKMHNGPTEVNKLKSAVVPKGKDQVPKPWQGSEKASAIKVPEASLTPRVMNASPLRSSSNSFGFPSPHENAKIQSIKAVIQAPKMPKYTFARCQNDRLLPDSRFAVISPSLHHKASIMTNGYEANENTEVEPLTPMGQKKGEKIPLQYSFQVEGRRIHVKVDKEGVFHVQEVGKPPSPPPSVNVVKSGEKLRPNTNGVNGERSTSLGSSIKATDKAREIQSQPSSSAQLESESSGKSIGVNGTPNKCSISRSKNSPIHEILRRSIRSLSGKLTPRFSCQANQQMGNSHTVIEEEKMSGSDCEFWVPLTASEIPFQTDSKRITSKIFSTNSQLKMHNTSEESMIPCNQNDHQAILDHCRGTRRRTSTTSSQMLFRGVGTAVGSSYTDALPIVSSTKSHRSKKKKRVYANAESENVNKPVSYTHYSNYKSGDCVQKRGSWADERDCIVEDFDSYPKTKNSTLFTYDCQSDSETSIGISASMNMGKQLRLQAGYMDSAKPATPYHHFSLLGFSGGEEDSTRPHVEKQHAPIIRSNSAPLFLRKKTLSNHLFSNQGTPEPALSNSDTDNIMETPFNEDYCDLQEGTEAQAQADLTNRNNSAREEGRITTRKVSNRKIYSEEFLQQCSNFSNQNNYFKSHHEQVTHPQLTTLRSPRLLPPLNDSLVCGDVKKIVSVGSQLSNEKEKNVTMFPVEIDKDDTSLRNDGNSTESVKEKSSDSETEDPSPMSTTLTLLLEGLCGTGGGAMDSRVSTRSEPQRFNTKCKKRPCVNENVRCASKPTTNGQNKGEGKRVETSAHNCLKFKENKSFLLRKRQNCNHTSVRCMACLKKQQKQTLAKPEIHFFAKGILKHPFRKARRKDKRSPKDTIFKKSSKGSPRSETKKRRRGHLTKPSGDRCCCASLSRRWRSSSRHKTRSHASSCCNRMASFGIDTDGYGPNTSTECYTFQLVEPSVSIEQPSPDFSRCKYDPLMHQSRLFRQCSDVSVAPRSASLSQYSRKHFVSASSPKSRSVSMPTAEENEDDGEVENSTKFGKPNFIFPPPYNTSHAPGKLSLNSSSKTGECQSLMGDFTDPLLN
ncbi:hypothetical protein EGR_05796 [Echinococcus granulosus]|uniref:Uncharacterized protein n=1 Tax=Echinococcus granulosus TaxID=6210 RepID=W6UMF6_ECHGR|nr:hypothetical protein EGR_05796 [Echinococcus granulosus]EUB59312.1 hypothetical protein EGR_05796 [Echinococcus granulosus]